MTKITTVMKALVAVFIALLVELPRTHAWTSRCEALCVLRASNSR